MDVEFLGSVNVFSELSDSELENILKVCRTRKYPKNSMIILEEEMGDVVFIVMEGTVKITRVNDEGKEVILAMKAMMLLEESFPGIISRLLSKKVIGTKTAVSELLKGKVSLSQEINHSLLIAISENPYLFTNLEIRRVVVKKTQEMGDFDLAFWLAMKCVEINPQDHQSALIGLESAISMGDDEKILLTGGILLSMKNEPEGIKYSKISASAIRKGRVGYAQDLLKRRRMKLDLDGHRKRIGICFQEKNWEGVFEELEITPKPFSENDSLKSYRTLALTEKGDSKGALKSINEIRDGLERTLLKYNLEHSVGNFNAAMWALNEHFSKNGMETISESWGNSNCNFLEIGTGGSTVYARDSGRVSVIMTCHRYNDALPLALKSISEQNYPHIQFIF